ncbi:MAG TPA: ATP-binding protein [Pyrinomonadaceae bacterium]|jgi:signal transduction histidine kinase
MRYASRIQWVLTLLGVVFLLATLLMVTLVWRAPAASNARVLLLLTVFLVTLCVSVLSIVLLLRWTRRPIRQLVGEAERAPVAARAAKPRDEAQFVLETFQTIVAQLQAQQRELEKLSAQASARAASAEKFSERIVASVPSGLVAFDAGYRATLLNAPARTLLEADGAHVGTHLRELLRAAPDLAEMVERCIQTGELYRREEILATSPDGRTRRLGATVAPIDPSPEQGARGALCLLTDITEVTNLREQVALKRNLESLGEMAAGLSHEFKNALATLHGYAQLLQTLSRDERGQAAAAALLQEVRSLTGMVTAFLNFARPQPLDLASVSLRELIADCDAELQALFSERRVHLKLSGDFPEIRADERMLRQALINLLRNAAEAIPEESTERRVSVRGSVEHDADAQAWANIEIEDTGEGIAAADLQRIFIPFFTTKSKGHGIGLALAHRVVTEHGGTLVATNSADGGALFTVRLPIKIS